MVTIKTDDAAEAALNWLVAKYEGVAWLYERLDGVTPPGACYTRDHQLAEPLIEREGIRVREGSPLYFPKGNERGYLYERLWIADKSQGSTPLIAAMRCFIVRRIGNIVEIPAELLQKV